MDAKRVAEFAVFYYQFPQTFVTLTVSIVFLIKLIGWKSLLAGLAVIAIAMPLNIYTSNRYSDAQGELMKVRDEKMVVVTEALQGIRQIKFSAQEEQWQKKIGKKRDKELATQWRVFCFDTGLMFIWILGPVVGLLQPTISYCLHVSSLETFIGSDRLMKFLIKALADWRSSSDVKCCLARRVFGTQRWPLGICGIYLSHGNGINGKFLGYLAGGHRKFS